MKTSEDILVLGSDKNRHLSHHYITHYIALHMKYTDYSDTISLIGRSNTSHSEINKRVMNIDVDMNVAMTVTELSQLSGR